MSARWLGAGLVLACLPLTAQADNAKPAAKTFHVPYKQTQTQHILVRAKINGKGPFNFILDTGAPALFVSTAVGKQLHIEPDGHGWGHLDRFEIEGGVVVPNARARIEDPFQLEGINGLGLAGVRLDGIIGYTVLARYRLVFDFTKDKLDWTPLDYKPPAPLGVEGHGAAAGGLDVLGAAMKMFGMFLGKKPAPETALRGFMGIELAANSDSATVKSVLPDSPAQKAGITAGDRITRLQNRRVADRAALSKLAGKFVAGQEVHVTVRRGDKTLDVTVKMGDGL
jgi:membrane-associated protease RseP (regulator of RpoE activity)